MSEIKTDLIKLEEGQAYVAKVDDYVITDEHTLADIIRFMIAQADIDEVITLAQFIKKEKA